MLLVDIALTWSAGMLLFIYRTQQTTRCIVCDSERLNSTRQNIFECILSGSAVQNK